MSTATINDAIAEVDARDDAVFVESLNSAAIKQRFDADNQFIFLDEFLPADTTARIQARIPELVASIHRNYIPRHK